MTDHGLQVSHYCGSAMVRDAWDKGRKIQVHGWVYSLNDGLIKDLKLTRTKYEAVVGGVEVEQGASPLICRWKAIVRRAQRVTSRTHLRA